MKRIEQRRLDDRDGGRIGSGSLVRSKNSLTITSSTIKSRSDSMWIILYLLVCFSRKQPL